MSITLRTAADNVGTTLASPHSGGDNTLVLNSATGFPSGGGYVTAITADTYQTASETFCHFGYTGVSGNTLTGVAALAGQTDPGFASASIIEMRGMAEYINDLNSVAKAQPIAQWTLGYGVNLATGTDLVKSRPVAQRAGVFNRCDLFCDTAPTGSGVIVNIYKSSDHGTTWVDLWTNSANYPTVAAAAKQGSQTSFDNATYALGDVFRIDVIQVGSTVTGSNLSVKLC